VPKSQIGRRSTAIPDEVDDAEGDAGRSYTDFGLINASCSRGFMRPGTTGPTKVAGTIAAGEQVASFRMIHIPGHAPGDPAIPA
jgi:hypothetical protein